MDSCVEFDKNCCLCPRLASFLAQTKVTYPSYYAAPVPPFGDPEARLLIVGLAPGLHGANASGRPFTGDHAGIILYKTLYESGFSNQPESSAVGDGLQLVNCRITNAVKCVPPENKPTSLEIITCNLYLHAELTALGNGCLILALGTIAHKAVLKGFGLRQAAYPFGHGKEYVLPNGLRLFDSYHCSRYNTQTGRLTEVMFKEIFVNIRQVLHSD